MKVKLKKKFDPTGFGNKFRPKGTIIEVDTGLGKRLIKEKIAEEWEEPKEVKIVDRASPVLDEKGKNISVTEIIEEDGK